MKWFFAGGILFLLLFLIGCAPEEEPAPDPYSLLIPQEEYLSRLDEDWPFERAFSFEEDPEGRDHRVLLGQGKVLVLSQFQKDRKTVDYITLEVEELISREELDTLARWIYQTVDERPLDEQWEEVFLHRDEGGMVYAPPYRLDLVFDEGDHFAEVHITTSAVE